jgi:hypothetical protein
LRQAWIELDEVSRKFDWPDAAKSPGNTAPKDA